MRVGFFILLALSALWGIYEAIDAVFISPGIFDFAEMYYFEIPLYVLLGFSFWGGIALLLALVLKKEWGYPLALAWVFVGIASTSLMGLGIWFDDTFLLKYMLAITPPGERDIGELAQTIGSSKGKFTSVFVTVFPVIVGLFYIRMIYKNRDYFCH